jgi:hypothetical protein
VVLDQLSTKVDAGPTPGESNPTREASSRQAGTQRRDGRIEPLPVDPASTVREGKELDDWDTVSSTERILRTERTIADLHTEMKSAVPDDVERYRQRALMALSAARADFFATKSGTVRYEQLERDLEEK